MQHLHRTPTLGPFEARLPPRNIRSPQMRDVGRETSFRRGKPAGQGLPLWIKKQGFKGAVVAAFLGGVILCCVVLLGTVVKPEEPVRVKVPVRVEKPVTTKVPVVEIKKEELAAVRKKLEAEIEKNEKKEKERKLDKEETDRLRDIIKQEHYKEGRQQQELVQRLKELEKAHARLQEKHEESERKKQRILPYTISPEYKKAHHPREFIEGMAVRSKVDILIGKTVIVQAGALGIIQNLVEKASPDEEDAWKIQFVSTLGKRPAMVPKVKASEIQKVDVSQLAAQSAAHMAPRKKLNMTSTSSPSSSSPSSSSSSPLAGMVVNTNTTTSTPLPTVSPASTPTPSEATNSTALPPPSETDAPLMPNSTTVVPAVTASPVEAGLNQSEILTATTSEPMRTETPPSNKKEKITEEAE